MAHHPKPRNVISAMSRGCRGQCPACGQGKLIEGYLRPAARCSSCDEHLAPYRTADFAAYIVMFFVGLIATPIVVAISLTGRGETWMIVAIMAGAAALALVLLPPVKGAVIGLLWALDIQSNI